MEKPYTNPLKGATGYFLLFVYGTLKSGGVRHGVLAKQRYVGEAHTLPNYALYHLGAYPGLVHTADEGRQVQGELYEVSCSLVDQLDAVEGAPGLFRMENIDINGYPGPIWAYFFQGSVGRHSIIPGGIWDNR